MNQSTISSFLAMAASNTPPLLFNPSSGVGIHDLLSLP
jgi:hypothetical protein